MRVSSVAALPMQMMMTFMIEVESDIEKEDG